MDKLDEEDFGKGEILKLILTLCEELLLLKTPSHYMMILTSL